MTTEERIAAVVSALSGITPAERTEVLNAVAENWCLRCGEQGRQIDCSCDFDSVPEYD